MTTIHGAFAVGDNTPAFGFLECTPSPRHTTGNVVDLPSAAFFPVEHGQALFDLSATGADWCWRITERFPGISGTVRYVSVPISATTIEYTDLADVDPATLDPAAGPTDPAWWTAVSDLQTGLTTATSTLQDAITAATSPLVTQLAGLQQQFTSVLVEDTDPDNAGLYSLGI